MDAQEISVDWEACQGHGKCYLLAPKVYAPDDDDEWGKAVAIVGRLDDVTDPDGSLRGQAELGRKSCPESAIRITTVAPKTDVNA